MAERRKFIRFDAFLNAFQLHDMVLGPPERVESRLRNVSREGLRLTSQNLLPKGSSLELEISMPGNDKPVAALGEVMWSQKREEPSSYETGLRFKEIESADKARLLDYAYEEWLRFLKGA